MSVIDSPLTLTPILANLIRGVWDKGRKKSLTTEQIILLQNALTAGVAKARIARNLGVSRETVYRYLRGNTCNNYNS